VTFAQICDLFKLRPKVVTFTLGLLNNSQMTTIWPPNGRLALHFLYYMKICNCPILIVCELESDSIPLQLEGRRGGKFGGKLYWELELVKLFSCANTVLWLWFAKELSWKEPETPYGRPSDRVAGYKCALKSKRCSYCKSNYIWLLNFNLNLFKFISQFLFNTRLDIFK